MASAATFFLMALLVLLAISKKALPQKSKSENVDVKQLEFLLKADLVPGEDSSGIERERSPPPEVPSSTPHYKSNTLYAGISLKESPLKKSYRPYPPKRSPQNNIPSYTPYTGIPPKQSPLNNIPSYTAYAGIAPTTPHLSIPSYPSYTGSDRYIPKKPPRLGVPSKTPFTSIPPSPHTTIPSYTAYAGVAPPKPPHLTVPSYTPYIQGEDDTREPDPGRVGSVPEADRP